MSWEEDAAFRRLLDTYYTTEKPLPVDLRAVCRLVLATTDSQREAVRVVLDEFFVATPVGWINARADQEIDSMRDKKALNEAKETHEKERMKRHRERRSVMFEALREHGVMPAWDVSIKDLQRLHDETCNAPVTHLQRAQAVSVEEPATAIPIPIPTPTPNNKEDSSELLTDSKPKIVLSEFSVNLVDSTDFHVPIKTLGEWENAYPAVDVRQELREMRAWSMANRTKRKTRRGVEAFMVRWLAKAQDTPSRSAKPGFASAGDWTAAAV